MMAKEYERLLKSGYSRKPLPLKMDKLRTSGNKRMRQRLNTIYVVLQVLLALNIARTSAANLVFVWNHCVVNLKIERGPQAVD